MLPECDTDVADRIDMLHNDMNLSMLMVYAQSIKEPKRSRISMNLKRSGSNEQNQPRFNKRAPNQYGPSAPRVKIEGSRGSQRGKPTCVTCGKKHYGKYLASTGCCYGCGKGGHKVRDCPTIAERGREANKDPPSVPEGGDPKRKRSMFFKLKEKIWVMMPVSYRFLSCVVMGFF